MAHTRVGPEDRTTTPWWQKVLIGAGAIFLGLGLLGLIQLIARPLGVVLMGMVIAAALSPIIDRLSQWLPRVAAVVIVYLLLVAIAVGLGWFVIPPLLDEFTRAISQLPEYIQQVQSWLQARSLLNSGMLLDSLSSQLSSLGSTVIGLPLRVGSTILDILLLFFVSIYWQLESRDLKRFFVSLFPSEQREEVSDITGKVGQAMGGYIRGVVIDGVIIGALMYIGLLLIGVNYALVLAVLGGLLELIPFVGPLITAIPITLTALLQSPTKALIAAAFLLALQQLEGHIITPNVLHSQTQISPLLVLVALFIGGSIGGLLGALLAVPLAAAARVLIVEVLAPALRNVTGADDKPPAETEAQ